MPSPDHVEGRLFHRGRQLQTAPRTRQSARATARRPIDGELDTAGFLRLAATGKDVRRWAAKARIDYGGVHAEFDGR